MSEPEAVKTTQYVTFKLGEEIYALDVTQVLEVLDVAPITKVPQSSEFMCGVINVRGSVVPVVDLRLKFGLVPSETTVNTRIVVMEINIEEENTVVGAMADSVLDVMDMEQDRIEPPPRVGAGRGTEYIQGIGKHDNDFILILDIDRVFSTDEMVVMQAVEEETRRVGEETAP